MVSAADSSGEENAWCGDSQSAAVGEPKYVVQVLGPASSYRRRAERLTTFDPSTSAAGNGCTKGRFTMRRVLVTFSLASLMVLGPASVAGAEHTGCEHARTVRAHQSVPHLNQGTHQAHMSIPYCPPT
jgi:hypothetical protein